MDMKLLDSRESIYTQCEVGGRGRDVIREDRSYQVSHGVRWLCLQTDNGESHSS